MNKSQQLYDNLLTIPLFQGMSRNDLSQIEKDIKFGFYKFKKGKNIIEEGTICDKLYLLVKGTVDIITKADDNSYMVIEDMPAPNILQIERLFGLTQRYTRAFTAKTECDFITIEKDEIMKLTEKFIIFRLNMLNIVSTRLQKIEHQPWRHNPNDLCSRIGRFFDNHCLRPAGTKEIYIKMEQLADELNETRLHISQALNKMKNDNLITLHRGRITIPALERITNYIS